MWPDYYANDRFDDEGWETQFHGMLAEALTEIAA
jgi:hypothetical protein